MRSRRRAFILLSVLVGLALSGLIVVQVAYLDRAYDRELRIFSRNVNSAMSSIVRKVEAREIWMMVSSLVIGGDEPPGRGTVTLNIEKSDDLRGGQRIIAIGDTTGYPGLDIAEMNAILRDCRDSTGMPDENFISIIEIDSTGSDTTSWAQHGHDSIIVRRSGSPDSIAGRRYIVEKILHDMSGRRSDETLERIDPALLDSVVTVTLAEAGIRTPFAYAITSAAGDSFLLAVPDGYEEGLSATGFRTRLFPNDIPPREEELLFYFPDQSSYLLGQERAFLVVALLSIFLIGGCFIYVIRTLMDQKRFSTRLVDFINNMTHEFKTPVSTIAIVGENLRRGLEHVEPERLENYSRILSEESGRMRHQVEKILEMAALEEGRINLSRDVVDIPELLEKAAEGVSLRLASSGGTIETSGLQDIKIEGDMTHLANVFHNLLDNAVKYTSGSPRIVVTTGIEDGQVAVSVKDDGIGIKKEDLRFVFDRYYRVGTGNLHDVKGFGLGLSYVRLIVEAHGGSVSVASSPGRGSTFTVRLPRRIPD